MLADGALSFGTMKDENHPAVPVSDHRSASRPPVARRLPGPRGRGRQAAVLIVLALAAKLAVLLVLNRPLGCDCGQIWSVPGEMARSSRTALDPYSLQHLIFGAALVAVVRRIRPDWPLWTLLAAVVVSSTIWEMAENLPASIALFGYSSGDPLAYDGDSIANSMADTAAAVLGGVLAVPVAGWVVVLTALGVEIGTTAWIGDGFIPTLARMIAG